MRLHAAVRCEANDRERREPLCRRITRPALSNERVQCNAAGQVELKLKSPWRDGTTHLAMTPLEFMRGLAARIPSSGFMHQGLRRGGQSGQLDARVDMRLPASKADAMQDYPIDTR